jgi:hypothetical protein
MNRYLATVLALLFASVTISSTCFAHPVDQATRSLPITAIAS